MTLRKGTCFTLALLLVPIVLLVVATSVDWEESWLAGSILLFLAIALFLVVPIWYLKSIGTIGESDVGVRLWWGKPEEKVLHSGLVFVPYFFGIRFNGRTLCEVVTIPTAWLQGKFASSQEDHLFSKDGQRITADLGWEIRLPFNEPNSLVKMIKAGVPLTEADLQGWIRSETIAGLKDILAMFDHDQLRQRSQLTTINQFARDYFLRSDGLFAKSGICGNNPINFDEGTGEVIIRVETVNFSEDLTEAMEEPVVAGYEAQAAASKAKIEGILAGGPLDVLMNQWIVEQAKAANIPLDTDGSFNKQKLAKLVASLKKDGSYIEQTRIYKELILADSGNLQVSHVLFGSPDGKQLPPNLQFLSIGDSRGGAGVLFGGKGGKGGGDGKSGKRKRAPWNKDLDK